MSVRNGTALLLALCALTFLIACGGSSSPKVTPPPSGGFRNSSLNGTYVVSFSGIDYNLSSNTSSFFALVGTLTADGNGNITGGTVDLNDPEIGGLFVGQAVSHNTYSVTTDGRGTGTLVTPQGAFGIDFVLTSNGHGLITRFDGLGSGSGTMDVQTSASQTSLQSLAFSLTGTDSSGFALGSVGGLTLDSAGQVTAGTQDFNDGGSSGGLTNLSLTVPGSSVVLASSTQGTAQLDSSFGSLSFDVWVIDSTHLKLIETDSSTNVLAGDAFTQQTSIPAGTLAFTLGGFDSQSAPFVAGGLLTSDGNGNLSGFEDFNDSGTSTVTTAPNVAGTCTLIGGRCQIALTGFSNGSLQAFQYAAYPSNGGIQLLEVDSFGLTQGAAYVQTSTSFSTPQGYGLNLTGIDLNSGFEVDDIAEFTAQNGGLTGIVDINDGGTAFKQSLGSGSTYTPDSPANGRGSISTAQFGLEYYTVDSSTVIFIEGDNSQIALGTFQLQNTSSAPGLAQPAVSMLRQAVRAHAALRKRK